jgi:hypothetical protein
MSFSVVLSRAAMNKNRARFAVQITTPSHRIVLSGVNSVRDANLGLMAGLTWQQYPAGIIYL